MKAAVFVLCVTALAAIGQPGPNDSAPKLRLTPTDAAQADGRNLLAQLEATHKASPGNVQIGLQLVAAYAQLRQTNDALAVLDSFSQIATNDAFALVQVAQAHSQLGQRTKSQVVIARLIPLCDRILADPQASPIQLQAALQAYQLASNVPRMEDCLKGLLRHSPTSPELWYDLGAILNFQQKTNAALAAVSNAVHHSDLRLRQNPAAQNLRGMAVTDGRFYNIRPHPDFKKIVTPEP